MGGISIWQLLIVLLLVIVLFGTKKLRNLGGDLGSAIKGFKKAVKDDGSKDEEEGKEGDGAADSGRVIEGEVTRKEKEEV